MRRRDIDPERQAAACAPLVALIEHVTGARVEMVAGTTTRWSGGPDYQDEYVLYVNASDEALESNLLHELCHWATSTEAMRQEYNLGLPLFASRYHAQWSSYKRDSPLGYMEKRVEPWEYLTMCLEMDVWAEARHVPDVDRGDYMRASFMRMRGRHARAYLERVLAERVPAGLVRDAAVAFRASVMNMRALVQADRASA
jgi:hypothetical protein